MVLQARAICCVCAEPIDDPVFEAPCGHEGCASVVFHALCLMRWRERRGAARPPSDRRES